MLPDVVVVDGPSNLGLRPPAAGTVPGCYKLAGALRDQGFLQRIGAADAGCVTPPRYDRGDWKPGDGVFNAGAMAGYSVKLADRIGRLLAEGNFVVLLGGECSNLLGPALALKRRGRYGVVYLDGHSDLRTVDNDEYVGAAGGEALALVTGRGQDGLTDLEGLKPYIRDTDAVMLGYREDEAYLETLREAGIRHWSALDVIDSPADVRREDALSFLRNLELAEEHVTVVWHSVMWQYLSPEEQAAGDELIAALGTKATPTAPLARLCLEPMRRTPEAEPEFLIALQVWPGAERRILGRADPHGLPAYWE